MRTNLEDDRDVEKDGLLNIAQAVARASSNSSFSERDSIDIPQLREQIRRLTQLEEDEKKIGASKEEGWSIKENAQAYSAACKLFLELEKEHLNRDEIEVLEKAYSNIRSLKDDVDELIAISTTPKYQNSSLRDGLDQIFLELAERQISRLRTGDKELYLNYGFDGEKGAHYEIVKLSTKDDINYQVIIYNAGGESEFANKEQKRVKVATRYNNVLFDSPDSLKEFIAIIQRQQFLDIQSPEFLRRSEYIKRACS